jgi:hypothetical protein
MNTKDHALDLALEALENNRRTHYYCEDTWYSCPKHEDGCANEAEGDECNCGADKANQEIDKAITAIKQARSAPYVASPRVQEPAIKQGWDVDTLLDKPAAQRQWTGLTDAEIEPYYAANKPLIKWVEAKLKAKNFA